MKKLFLLWTAACALGALAGTDVWQGAPGGVGPQNRCAEQPDLARDPNRPQLRYTPRFGWVNDPNGLTWQNGEWRFFYQHNPTGTQWGNMHWGYAVSTDLVHWEEQKPVLAPDAMGMMFSGSGVVDRENTAGFGKAAHVLLYTAAGEKGKPFTQ